MVALRFLLLAEGNAETSDSWSGSSRSIVEHLRRRGFPVTVANVELSGARRWIAAASAFSVKRPRWRARYLLGKKGFQLRSGLARRHVSTHAKDVDVVMQVGATFDSGAHVADLPYVVISDSNICMAKEPSIIRFTEAGGLTSKQLRDVEKREAFVYRRAASVLTLSERARQSFIMDFAIAPERVATIHAGPNAKLPVTAADHPQEHRPVVLFVGRQFQRKGGDVLLRAFGKVRQRVPNAELWIVGPDPAGDQDGVRWLGFLSQDRAEARDTLREAYRVASVFCLPTRFEPLGIAFIEAMHLGLPCIGTNVWAVPEMIVDNKTGFVVAMDDDAALEDRLVRLLTDPALAQQMGLAGRERARAMFTWDVAIDKLLAAIAPHVRR